MLNIKFTRDEYSTVDLAQFDGAVYGSIAIDSDNFWSMLEMCVNSVAQACDCLVSDDATITVWVEYKGEYLKANAILDLMFTRGSEVDTIADCFDLLSERVNADYVFLFVNSQGFDVEHIAKSEYEARTLLANNNECNLILISKTFRGKTNA